MSTAPIANREARLVRRELKFTVPLTLVPSIVDYLDIYCEQDPFSKVVEGGFYRVNSLYLDSKNFRLLQNKKNKAPRRFNLRVRCYGDGKLPPYFFEMKCKSNDFVDKLRSQTTDPDWAKMFTYNRSLEDFKVKNNGNFMTFMNQACFLNAEPKILTQYERLAYFSTVDDYARVTFDKNLRYQCTDQFSVTPDDRQMINYDVSSIFDSHEPSVVLELKSGGDLPHWMKSLIQIFNLRQRSFSKYERSLDTSVSTDIESLVNLVPSNLYA